MKSVKVKYLILGAGPGGLQMGYFMEQANMDYLVLERNEVAGSFFRTNPVHRKLISINKKYNYFEESEFNWRHDWNSLISDDPKMRLPNYTEELFPQASILCDYLEDYAKHFNIKIQYNTEIKHIAKDDSGSFIVTSSSGQQFEAEVLLSGLGAASLNLPDIPGAEYTMPYEEQSVNLDDFKNKRVAVMGGGNSGFETADYLAQVAAYVHVLIKGPLKMAWDTHFVGDLRAINNGILDMYQLKSMHAVLNPTVTKIEKLEDGTLRTNHEYDYPKSSKPGTLKLTREYDYIINCTGWKWSHIDLYDDAIKPSTRRNGKYLNMHPNWESENVSDLYFIGAVMQSIDRKSASGFIHGFRYNIRSLFHLLMEKYENIAYPSVKYPDLDTEKLLTDIYDRFSLSAGLFQLYGLMSDVITFNEDGTAAEAKQEIPLKYVEKVIPEGTKAIVMSLEFGFHKHEGSALDFLGPSDPHDTPCAAFLHPVIRFYHNGLQDEFHFGDSLLGRWDRPHGTGGAVGSYHYQFLVWLRDVVGLNIDVEVPDPTAEKGAYQFWDDVKIAEWKAKEEEQKMEVEVEAHCARP